jgi:hypothetical protein
VRWGERDYTLMKKNVTGFNISLRWPMKMTLETKRIFSGNRRESGPVQQSQIGEGTDQTSVHLLA